MTPTEMETWYMDKGGSTEQRERKKLNNDPGTVPCICREEKRDS